MCFRSLGENLRAMAVVDHKPHEPLSRWKRAFGGTEPVNMTLVNININGPSGWIPLACGVFVDNVIHLSGYVALGMNSFYTKIMAKVKPVLNC